MQPTLRNPASFRDPAGFVFRSQGILYRAVMDVYKSDYDLLMGSGLYERLSGKGWLIPHTEVDDVRIDGESPHMILAPDEVPFISYPYEWSFSQLKSAALLTLEITTTALDHGMILKDASAFNVQFVGAHPIFIDTLSFSEYSEGEPWIAYRQFCRHYLAPLALSRYCELGCNSLSRLHIDGVPLGLASSFLPLRSWMSPSLFFHIHLHARAERSLAGNADRQRRARLSKTGLKSLLLSLSQYVADQEIPVKKSTWYGYYEKTNYSQASIKAKEGLVKELLRRCPPGIVWDLGANDGRFSRIARDLGHYTVAFDQDAVCTEANFRQCQREKDRRLLPLQLDLTNPSPAIGWRNEERSSVRDRGPATTVLALALIHHLAIVNNVPFSLLARFFADVSRHLIIEFIPKSDSKVQGLLATRDDIFTEYTQGSFEQAFADVFAIDECLPVPDSERLLYKMTNRALPA